MRRTAFSKRFVSFMLAAALTLSNGVGAVLASAADAYYIRFYDMVTKANSTNTTLVEGAPINIQAKLPSTYSFSNTPFAVRQNIGGVSTPISNIADVFQIVPNTDSSYSLTPKVLSPLITDENSRKTISAEYTLEALYTANVTQGSANLFYKTIPDESGKFEEGYNSLDVVSDGSIPITSDSTITFAVKNDQTSDNSVTFTTVSSATGYFKDKYEGQVVNANAITGSGNSRCIPVTIHARSDADPLTLSFKIYLSGVPQNVRFAAGSSITVSFTRQTISPLIATVITREKALEDTRYSILQNPTATGVTTTNEPYINLAKDETLQSIQSNFTVLSQIHRHNIDVDIEWSWTADQAIYQDYVSVERVSDPKKKAFEIKNRPENDMTGSINFVVKYTYTEGTTKVTKESDRGSIPVTFYGTGKPPKVMPMQTYTGKQNGDDRIATLTDFTQTMNLDVYTGTPTYYDFDPSVPEDRQIPTDPYKLTTSLYFGDGRGRAEYAIIRQNSVGGEFEVYLDGTATPYKFGDKVENVGNYRAIEIIATKRGQTKLVVEFYNSKNELITQHVFEQNFYINDSTPNDDGTLESLILKGETVTGEKEKVFEQVYPNRIIDYGFKPDQNAYNINLPNCVEKVTFTPKITVGSGASTNVYFSTQSDTVSSGSPSNSIALETETPKTVKITVTAQDGSTNSYTLTLLRVGKSSDASLSSFEAYKNNEPAVNVIPGFSATTYDYTVTVPYSTEKMTVWAVPNSPWIVPDEPTTNSLFTVKWWTDGATESVSLAQRIVDFFVKSDIKPQQTFILKRPEKVNGVYEQSATTEITATVTAEDGSTKRIYKLTVICLAPSTDNLLQSLTVTDVNSNAIPFEYNATFRPDLKEYLVRIPYSTSTVTITAQARDDVNSLDMSLDSAGYSYTRTPTDYNPNIPTVFTIKNMDPVRFNTGEADPNLVPFIMKLEVTAESHDNTTPPYTIEFQREDPSDDSRLKSLTMTDQDGAAVPTFSFNAEQLEYEVEVPFLTSQISVTPVQSFYLSKVTVNDKEITKTKPSFTTGILPAGSTYELKIVVTAENFSTRTYTIKIKRDKPSDEARLSALSVGALELKPKFNPNTLKYDVTIPEGTKGMVVTPTAASPYATITVDKMAVASGSPSHTINPLEAHSKVYVVVTAQDGKTKNTYTLNVTDENLITKSDNADLYSLAVVTANLNPKFNASVTEYEAYVKEDVYSVDIIPKTANRYADVTVYSERREIGDYDGNYAVSLFDDETEITVEVVSQDKKVTKEYVVTIYRGDEEKQGIYDPITAEEVNFTVEDPIKIDITKYPLVAADVFNTLKTDYPDKSILFTGNDYTLSIKGSDMDTLVPNTEYFDLSITFSPPNEDEIWEAITDLDSSNNDLDPVYIHFNHHGALPAPMKLTISLGSAYRNRELFWNYYNEERERIDYYGFVLSNAKGSFALPLTHMSTYIVTIYKIVDAEDKVGALVGYDSPGAPESLTKYLTYNKANPNTGAGVR